MTTKYLTGAYPAGYALNAKYDTLAIAGSATVGGAGITTVATQASTIENWGAVTGTGHGITLSDGGVVKNQTMGAASGAISGVTAIVAFKGSASVSDAGAITSDGVVNGYTTTFGVSIRLFAGGSVKTVSSAAKISNGVVISGGGGSVSNRGKIGGGETKVADTSAYKYTTNYAASVQLGHGGTITNGANGTKHATLSNGVAISGGAGRVVNDGVIGSPSYNYRRAAYAGSADNSYSFSSGVSITLSKGGSVANGSATDTSAKVTNGVVISGGGGVVVNNGVIGGPVDSAGYSGLPAAGNFTDSKGGQSVYMKAGGTVTNGSARNVRARLTNGVQIRGGAGTVHNFGVIGGALTTAWSYYNSKSVSAHSIGFSAGGTVVNGAAKSTAASITSGVLIGGRAGTVTNFGKISGPGSSSYSGGKTVSSTSFSVSLLAGGRVTNGSSKVSTASLKNGVSLEGAAGVVTNFGVIGANSTGIAISFGNSHDTLVEEGTGALTGRVVGGGGTLELGAKAGKGTLAGLGQAISGFGAVGVDHGANWTLTGATTIAAKAGLQNSGVLTIRGAADIQANIAGAGKLDIGGGGKLQLDGSVAKTQAFVFEGARDILTLTDAERFAGVLSGFGANDKLDLRQLHSVTNLTFVENGAHTGGVLEVAGAGLSVHIAMLGRYTTAAFHVVADGHDGTFIT